MSETLSDEEKEVVAEMVYQILANKGLFQDIAVLMDLHDDYLIPLLDNVFKKLRGCGK